MSHEDRQTTQLGRVIRQRRLERNMTQEDLATEIGVRQSDISALERGHVQLPRRARLQALAAALGITLGELLAVSNWMVEGRGSARLWTTPRDIREAVERISPELAPADIDDLVRYARFLAEKRAESNAETR